MILDTNALSAFLDQNARAIALVSEARVLALPVIVAGEFAFGAAQSRYREEYDRSLQRMLDRCTVLSAAYRHTLKGPDRGKWEVMVKAEADAPVTAVDQVVRGVQRRADDTEVVDRMTGDEVRAVVAARRAYEELRADRPDPA